MIPPAGRPARRHAGPQTRTPGPAGAAPAVLLPARSARRRYALISFLTWLPPGLTLASMVLLMTARGLDLAAIGLVTAAYSATCIVLELPTGGLADVLGRRVVLAGSAAIGAAGLLIMAAATTPWLFLLASILKGVARALSSGPAQAWYVDALRAAEGPGADLKPGLAQGEAMGSVALCAGTLAGGFVPLAVPAGPVTPLAVPMVAGTAAFAVLLVVALAAMPEPPRPRPTFAAVLRDVPGTIGSGLRLSYRDRALTRLLLVALPLGFALSTIELLTPGRLAALTGMAETGGTAYAIVAALGFAANAVGAALAPAAARLLGTSARAAGAASALTAAALAALAATVTLSGAPAFAAIAGAYIVLFACLSLIGLLRAELMHQRVTSAQRATLMSVDSLHLQSGSLLAGTTVIPLAARTGSATPWLIAAIIVLASALVYRRRSAAPVAAEAPRPGH